MVYAERFPEEVQVLRQLTGINENYYLSIAEDLKDEEIEIKRAELRKLCSFVIGRTRELFLHIDELRYIVDLWRMDYNHYRPHSSLDYMAPAAFAVKCLEQGLPQDKEKTCEILS